MNSRAQTVTNPADLGILDSVQLLRSRELSAVELLAACQRRIAERNGGPPSFDGTPSAVNAWARLYPDLAQDMAVAADAVLVRLVTSFATTEADIARFLAVAAEP